MFSNYPLTSANTPESGLKNQRKPFLFRTLAEGMWAKKHTSMHDSQKIYFIFNGLQKETRIGAGSKKQKKQEKISHNAQKSKKTARSENFFDL